MAVYLGTQNGRFGVNMAIKNNRINRLQVCNVSRETTDQSNGEAHQQEEDDHVDRRDGPCLCSVRICVVTCKQTWLSSLYFGPGMELTAKTANNSPPGS